MDTQKVRAMPKKKRVTIISRESNEKTLDVAMLEAELKRRGAEVTVLSRLLTKEKSLKALGYIGHVLRQEAEILRSDVVVLDTYCIPASMLPHRRGTRVIQMWHALSAMKRFGWQTVGLEGGSSPKVARLMRMHHGYDYVISPSDITAEHFAEAFRVGRDRIAKQGLPRIDYIKSVSQGERQPDTARRILTRYPQLKQKPVAEDDRENAWGGADGKKIVLYAPTFRMGKSVDVQSLIDSLDPAKFELVVKLHPLYRNTGKEDKESGQTRGDVIPDSAAAKDLKCTVIYDEEFSSYDWLSVCDIIISDYSSFAVESTLADRPLYIFAYDIEEYSRSTGLNVDYMREPVAPYVFGDAAALGKALDAACEAERSGSSEGAYDMSRLRAFRDRYIDIDTDDCTGRLADFVLSLA